MLPSSTDTARAGLLHEQPAELLQPAESKNFAFWPFRSFNHNVVVTWLQVVVDKVGIAIAARHIQGARCVASQSLDQ